MKRGRNQRRRPGGSNPNRALDSNGPDVRIRGTANQIYDKYLVLARDASSAGDRVKAESYLQHAEHYFRLIRSMQPAQQPNQQAADGDGEQPMVEDGDQDQPQREGRQRRDRRNGASNGNDAAADDDAGDKGEAAASASDETDGEEESKAAAPEEEKKPRRRRAPRRSTKKDDDSNEEAPAAAAAE